MSLKILKPGLLTSVQDLGRKGQMCNGVAPSGAMDGFSMKLANWLVDNALDSPVLEVTVIGPSIEFSDSFSIAVCGADFDLYLNGELVFNNQTIQIKAGDLLEFDRLNSGARAYLAFAGDLDFAKVMGSYSTNLTAHFGGYHGKELAINDQIFLTNTRSIQPKKVPEKFISHFTGNYYLRCVASIEKEKFKPAEIEKFINQSFSVTPDSNRMGIRLKGESIIEDTTPQIVSSGLTQGSVQVTPSGMPIISSVDGQTIGGYPRIANVISADLPLLGQLKANDKVRFCFVDMDTALLALDEKNKLFESIISES